LKYCSELFDGDRNGSQGYVIPERNSNKLRYLQDGDQDAPASDASQAGQQELPLGTALGLAVVNRANFL